MKRRTAREKALQALFQYDLGQIEPMKAIRNVIKTDEVDPFLQKLVLGTVEHLEEIDAILRKHLEKWTLERVAAVDRAILRLAVYEMMYEEEVPTTVSLNEAIELAKKFSDSQSNRFINGVLSKVLQAIK
jgi:transcription antitermination protein NusB